MHAAPNHGHKRMNYVDNDSGDDLKVLGNGLMGGRTSGGRDDEGVSTGLLSGEQDQEVELDEGDFEEGDSYFEGDEGDAYDEGDEDGLFFGERDDGTWK